MSIDNSKLSDWLAMQAKSVLRQALPLLQSDHGKGTSEGMDQDQTLTDAKIAASEARTDTKFERLIGRIDASEARNDLKFAQVLGEMKLISANVSSLGGQVSELRTEVAGVKAAVASSKATFITAIIGGVFSIVALAYAAVEIFEAALSLNR